MAIEDGFWTPERTQRLVQLWNSEVSSGDISGELNISRSAVVGKVHRLRAQGMQLRTNVNLAQRTSSRPKVRRIRRRGSRENQQRVDKLRPYELLLRQLQEEAATAPTMTDDAEPRITHISDLERDHCRWFIGEPRAQGKAGVGWCGEAVVQGLPYCAAHAQRAYQPPGAARRTSAAALSNFPTAQKRHKRSLQLEPAPA